MAGSLAPCRSDNGPEFRGFALDQWCYNHVVLLDFIQPVKPTQNAHIESFNGRFREECLNTIPLPLPDPDRVVEYYLSDRIE